MKPRTLFATMALCLLWAAGASAQGPQPLAPQPSAAASSATPAPSTPAKATPPALTRQDLEAWLDGLVPYALKSGNIAGADIIVVKDGKVLLEKGYGYADVGRTVAMDPETTMVRPGSTSKLFTWTAVMQLVEQGKLDLDRNVDDYLDFKVSPPGGKITLRDLMNHKAGFEEGLKGILTTDPEGMESTEAYLKNHRRPLLFAPGEVPAYSNYGASLAGYIVQRVSDEPFERYVERHIFLPLGMNHSTFDQPLPARFQAGLAKGYQTATSAPSAYEQVVTRPAGSVTTTAADMSRFMIAHLQQGRYDAYAMLQPQTAKLMHTPTESAPPGFASMAHGFFYDVKNGHTVIGHGGDTVVFHSELDLLPNDGVGIFYNFNSRGTASAVYGARQALFQGFMDRYFPAASPASDPPTLTSAPKDADEIAGRYTSSRRVEHGFISVFYLLQQAAITANPDGTINAPGALGGPPVKLHEVAPQVWREVNGERELALTRVNGVRTVVDSEDPISVLQSVSFARSAPLNLTIIFASIAVLIWTLVLWPLSPLLRASERAGSGLSPEIRRTRLVTRLAAAVAVVYLAGWFMVLQPVLGSQLQVYGPKLDPLIRTLQIAGLLVLAATAAALWSAWRNLRLGAPWTSRIWSTAAALAMCGIVWIAWVGGLLGFSLNY